VKFEPQTVLAGRYRIIGVLAEGGMGVVYRAHDERLDRVVAVKTVRASDPRLMVHLRREAQLLAHLTHPNVVQLYDVGEHAGQPYLVTQLVDGIPLLRLLGRMTARRIAWITEQVAHGLAAAHALGIVHRDLKPSNVLVGDGTVRLLDFGIAHHVDETTVTRPETVLGTASYISPEQLRGEQAGPEADIYALGLVVLECFSGQAAFPGSFAETMATRLVEPPVLPSALPSAWHDLLRAMTNPDPARRPSAAVVASAVRALGRARPGETPSALLGLDVGDTIVDERRVRVPLTKGAGRLTVASRESGPGAPAASSPSEDTAVAGAPVVVPLEPADEWSGSAPEQGTGRKALVGIAGTGIAASAVGLAAAAAASFLLVLGIGYVVSSRGSEEPDPAASGLSADLVAPEPPVATFPGPSTTLPTTTLPVESTTTQPPTTRATTTTTRRPTTTTAPPTTRATTTSTRRRTTTTMSERQREICRRWPWVRGCD
jgi:serine/threonine protein kinase